MPQQIKVSISIVSHGQAELVGRLLHDLRTHCTTPIEVILTLNVAELLPFEISGLGFPVSLIRNEHAKGFAANHNAAFGRVQSEYFCVLNPDINLTRDPFPPLMDALANPQTGVAAPLVVNPAGRMENSARRFPTPLTILRKIFRVAPPFDYAVAEDTLFPDWVAGMFMVFRSEVFREVDGFDEAYFLYYEDVDICWRLRRAEYVVVLSPAARVIHSARRESHRNLRYLRWHAASMLRFFVRRALIRPSGR